MNNNYRNAIFFAALALCDGAFAASAPFANQTPGSSGLRPCGSVTVDPVTYVTLGKSSVIRLDVPAARMLVGGLPSSRAGRPAAASNDKTVPPGPANAPPAPAQAASDGVADVDITLLSPTELFFLGRKAGSMNVVLQSSDGRCVIKDIIVTVDPGTLQAKLAELMPEETGIKVRGAENALVLTGKVSDGVKLDEAMSLATAYGDGKKVVNMLRIMTPQQVMLEVKIAEVSKTLLDKLGSSVNLLRSSNGGGNTYSLLSNFLSGGNALLQALKIGRTAVNIDGQKDDGLVRVLAEPNIMAISGQQASFLSGGKIFIPVSQTNNAGVPTITLEEKEFGIGVKFMPTVLDGTRINLKMVSEVSDLSQVGSPFTTVGGVTAVLPSLTVRRADTTVQLNDGQSFAIAGLIKNNVTETMKRFPGLGEVPVLGALFRSSEFQTDQTELLFVITPHLVKPLAEAPTLPTDNHVVPSRGEVYFNGSLEGSAPAQVPAPASAPAPAPAMPPAASAEDTAAPAIK
ncbi:type II and III secretion system protein family protein [Collimonas sp.]|uniref:type II and III secretion system protein family protein n=1 Tax=Collimonas sp. TaxID=1963772 RepID=UPI002C023BAE|nr:type II and III secretion system protein family protein [Collimonas sp.]HWW07246.1 type II and III secretion system protein family protein [Collimonas sp.]